MKRSMVSTLTVDQNFPLRTRTTKICLGSMLKLIKNVFNDLQNLDSEGNENLIASNVNVALSRINLLNILNLIAYCSNLMFP